MSSKQRITFHSFNNSNSLAEILKLPDPLFVSPTVARRQLGYVQQYARSLGCKTIVVEWHYIDRDYMEDHSVFYSKSLTPYRNYCRRVHFFSLTERQLRSEITRLQRSAAAVKAGTRPAGSDRFRSECRKFCRDSYVGFSVIKPLPGCPVGRTVLRCYPDKSPEGHTRRFDCACEYEVHLLGLPLQVRGLAFQQQDLGVSACATTALWTSLQRARQLEQGVAATPAQITLRASQFALPFGRSMPSEGLSLDQMSVAVQALGWSPNVFRTEDFTISRSLLYSAVSSGISPVLILFDPVLNRRHAVAVSGMATATKPIAQEYTPVRDKAEDLEALYVHDDRIGPYLKATIDERANALIVQISTKGSASSETWTLTHVLIPMHTKIRLSFGGLYTAGLKLTREFEIVRESLLHARNETGKPPTVIWSTRILRSHEYLQRLLRKTGTPKLVNQICESMRLSRYVGVISMQADDFDPIDILLDSTGTERNLDCLGVVQHAAGRPNSSIVIPFMAKQYRCEDRLVTGV